MLHRLTGWDKHLSTSDFRKFLVVQNTYRRVPPERPPYFHVRMARKRGGAGGGGRINGSDRFCTRGAPPILISAPRP